MTDNLNYGALPYRYGKTHALREAHWRYWFRLRHNSKQNHARARRLVRLMQVIRGAYGSMSNQRDALRARRAAGELQALMVLGDPPPPTGGER